MQCGHIPNSKWHLKLFFKHKCFLLNFLPACRAPGHADDDVCAVHGVHGSLRSELAVASLRFCFGLRLCFGLGLWVSIQRLFSSCFL